MTGINVRLSDGTQLTIKEGDKYEDLAKDKNLSKLLPLFDLIDSTGHPDGGDRVVNADELSLIEKALKNMEGNPANYDIEKYCADYFESGNDLETFINTHSPVKKEEKKSPDGRTSMKAFNQYIQTIGKKYDKSKLEQEFTEVHKIAKGDTLYAIAKELLQEKGVKITGDAINKCIAQIALVNNIHDVNNIRIGTEIKIGNSAADGGGTPPAGGAGGDEDGYTPESPTAGQKSTITVTPNGLDESWGEGEDVKDKPGIKKFTKGEGENAEVMYQTEVDDVKLIAPTVEKLEMIKASFEQNYKITKKPENETDEAAKARKANNLAKLDVLVGLSNGNIEVLKDVAVQLCFEENVDPTSPEYKALVKDLILTRNPEVLEALLRYDNGDFDPSVLLNDEEAHRLVAGIYKEIRDKEKAGVRLTETEHNLKDTLKSISGYSGAIIEKDEEGDALVSMAYDRDGNIEYNSSVSIDDGKYPFAAYDKELVKEFQAKYNAAIQETDEAKKNEKLQALYHEYKDKTDPEFVRTVLALCADELNASRADILDVIKNNGLEITYLDIDHLPEADQKEVAKAVLDRAKTLFTQDKGNLENTRYLKKAFAWLYKTDMTDEQKDAYKTEVLETYFNVTTDENGNKTYTFTPSRRPTKDEMYALAFNVYYNAMYEALVKSIKLEDMGKGEYNQGVEKALDGRHTVPHYAEMVDKMTTKEEVIDFIENKVAEDKNYHLPYDKIIEKFGSEPEVMDKLAKYVDEKSTISEENKLALVKHCMQIDEKGNVTFDKSKLPEGADFRNIINNLLPKDCTKGEAAKYFKAILTAIKPEENIDDFLSLINNHDMPNDTKTLELFNNKIKTYLTQHTEKAGSNGYNRLAEYAQNIGILDDADMEIIYNASSDVMKAKFINGGYTKDGTLVVVKSGDSVDKIVKNYLAHHLDKFPQLKNSVEANPSKWTEKRIDEALNDYMQDFRDVIMQELGISDPTKLKAGQILDLSKVNWEEHQPNWFNYNFTY